MSIHFAPYVSELTRSAYNQMMPQTYPEEFYSLVELVHDYLTTEDIFILLNDMQANLHSVELLSPPPDIS